MQKKLYITFVLVSLLLSFSACFHNKEEMHTVPETEQIPETTAETVGPIGLGRIPADDIIIETKSTEETVVPDKKMIEVKETQETQPSESIAVNDELDWGGGRA